jgi:hypothetical protein
MSNIRCERCGIDIPQSDSIRVNDKRLCAACAELEAASANSSNVCAQCGTDYGSMALPRVGGAPFCDGCREPFYRRDFPGWLKSAFVGLSIALVFAVYHAIPYFKAGREYYRAEKLYAQHRYSEAIPGFLAARNAGPDGKKIRQQLALAYLKNGQPIEAYAEVKGISFEQNPEFNEIQSYFHRFDKVGAKFDEAKKLAAEDHSGEAAQKLREAKSIYPELQGLDDSIEQLELGDAYERKDYDRFVSLAETLWKRVGGSMQAAELASALACRYAVNGDDAVKAQAEELLRTAESLIKSDEERKAFEEYKPRIQYRLDKREIIDRKEYNRRFRPDQAKEES